MLQDLKYALRALGRSPGFTAVAVLTLALGIGANTAIFSVVNSVLLQPLDFPEPERLVRISHDAPEGGFAVIRGAFSPPDFEDLERESSVFERLAAYHFIPGQSETSLVGGGEPEELSTAFVSAGFFSVLGVPAELGRVPAESENVPGADRVAVLNAAFWKRRFNADPGVIGRSITLDGESYAVIGVMPPGFDFPSAAADLWLPLSLIGEDDIPTERGLRWMEAVGRLAPGVSLAAARAGTDAILERLAAAYPDTNEGWDSATVVTLRDSLVGDVRPALLVLLGAVALVLLIACANLANLLLARGSSRGRELAIRAALGAGRARLVRQLLTESVLLALVGGAVGLILAVWGLDALVALSAGTIPRPGEIGLDARIAGFALVTSGVTGIIFGLIPSLSASRATVHDALNEGGRGTTGGRHARGMRGILVVAQTALAVVLLTGAGLLIRSFWNLTHVDPGFSGDNVLTLSISTPPDVLESGRQDAYRRELLQRVGNLPGVAAVGGSKTVPLKGGGEPYAFSIPGRADPAPVTPESGVLIVTSGYFRALGIPVLQGRGFTAADETADTPVLIVNQAFAARYLPGRDAVGAGLRLGDLEFPIVGVVGDVRNDGIAREPAPAVYVLTSVLPRSSMKLFIRTASDPLAMAAAVRRTIWEVNPDQPVSDIATIGQVIEETVARPRFFTLLLAGFAALAVILAALGVYGVIAYSVSRRGAEIGIRMALGARAGDVLKLVIGQGIAPALAGLVLGLGAAVLLTRVLSSQLYGVGAADPATFACVALLLLAIALLAGFVPAQRAARVDPMTTLRAE